MKKIASLIMSVALVSSAFAGPSYSDKGSKVVTPPPPPPVCPCFGPGLTVGLFGAGFIPADHPAWDDAFGGGALIEYFFTDYVGVQLSYAIAATDREEHMIDANLILRYPIHELCIAPYLLVGGGVLTNSETDGNFAIGGGIDIRFDSLGCAGLFADGAYHFVKGDRDYTLVRVGVKFPL